MIAQERYAAILMMIRETNIVKIGDIAEKLKVSNETARRDLETLQDQGLLKRVHGGAVLTDPLIDVNSSVISLKPEISYQEKAAIGKVAASIIRNGETIFLDIGMTTLQIARNIKSLKDLTVITTSLNIINELAGSSVNVIILGGKLIKDDLHIAAPFTEEIFSRYYIDRAFIGCGGLTMNGDITDYSDLTLRREIVKNHSDKMILTADSGKFGKKALFKVCNLDLLDTVITDENIPSEYRELILQKNLELIQAKIRH